MIGSCVTWTTKKQHKPSSDRRIHVLNVLMFGFIFPLCMWGVGGCMYLMCLPMGVILITFLLRCLRHTGMPSLKMFFWSGRKKEKNWGESHYLYFLQSPSGSTPWTQWTQRSQWANVNSMTPSIQGPVPNYCHSAAVVCLNLHLSSWILSYFVYVVFCVVRVSYFNI